MRCAIQNSTEGIPFFWKPWICRMRVLLRLSAQDKDARRTNEHGSRKDCIQNSGLSTERARFCTFFAMEPLNGASLPVTWVTETYQEFPQIDVTIGAAPVRA